MRLQRASILIQPKNQFSLYSFHARVHLMKCQAISGYRDVIQYLSSLGLNNWKTRQVHPMVAYSR
jgi:hypothetical protein